MTDHPLFPILALVPILYLSAFFHEVGHCLVGRAVGYTPTSLGMGTGRPFAVFSWRGTRVYFARSRPFQGLIFLFNTAILPSRSAAAWTMAGGILAHGVLAAVFFGLTLLVPAGTWLWQPGLGLNLALGLVNLAPLSIRMGNAVLRSDGAQILMHLRDGLVDTPPAIRTQNVELLRPLWTQIGDFLGLYGHLTAAALAWGELLDHERATRCYEDVRSLPVEHTPFVEAYTEFIGAALHRQAGRLEETRAALARAKEGFLAQQHTVGLLLLEMAEGELHLLEGKPVEAAAALDRMTERPEIRQRPAFSAALLATRVIAHLEAGNEQGETLLKEWERVRVHYPSLSRDRAVFGVLGKVRRQQGRLEEAAQAYERLLKALQEMHRGLVGLEGAGDFAANHAAVLAEARATLIEANQDGSLADPETLFPAPEQLLKQETSRRESENRRKHRIGFWWSVANLALSPVLIVIVALALLPEPGMPFAGLPFHLALLGTMLGFFGLLAMAYSLFMKIAVRWLPGLRTGGGRETLFLAVIPWISWVFAVLVPRD